LKVLAFPGPKPRPTDDAADAVAVSPEPTPTFSGQPPPPQYDRITVRAITVAVVLSLFVHFAIIFLPLVDKVNQEMKAPADEIGPLSVTIAQPKPQPQVQQPQQQQPAVQQPAPTPAQPKPTPRRPTPPRPQSQIAVNNGPRPPTVAPPDTTPQPPTPVPPTPQPVVPTTEDFTEVLAARQRARRAANGGAPDEVVESDDERANRIAKGNVQAQQRSASPGQDPDQAGGIFDLRHTGLNDAEFVFNGWNRTFRRSVGQTFEVRTGNNPDIRLAVIRKMIEIIREQKPGDFEWQSHRLNKVVVMSAREKDQPELESFLLKEFYPQDPRAQAR
jgi:hypothetical protein